MLVFLDAQNCYDDPDVQQERVSINRMYSQVIVPRANFTCYGRITNITISMDRRNALNESDAYFQVWRPSSNVSSGFNKVAEIPLEKNRIVQHGQNLIFNMHFNHINRIDVEAGDVIGYYQSSHSSYHVQNILTMGYSAYASDVPNSPNSLTTNNMILYLRHQPLVQIDLELAGKHKGCINYVCMPILCIYVSVFCSFQWTN